MGQYDLPRWQEGGITAQLCAIYLDDDQLNNPLYAGLEMTYPADNPAHAIACLLRELLLIVQQFRRPSFSWLR